MSDGRDELRRADAERLALALVAVPPRRMIEVRPAIDDLIRAVIAPQPVEVVRPADLVHLTFSFVNLQFDAGATPQSPPLLARRTRSAPHSSSSTATRSTSPKPRLFETAPKFPVTRPAAAAAPRHRQRTTQGSRRREEGIRPHQSRRPRRAPGPAALVERRRIEPARVPSHERVLALFRGGPHRGDRRARSQRRAPRRRRPRAGPGPSGASSTAAISSTSRTCSSPRTRPRSARRAHGGASTHPTGRRTSPRELIALGAHAGDRKDTRVPVRSRRRAGRRCRSRERRHQAGRSAKPRPRSVSASRSR